MEELDEEEKTQSEFGSERSPDSDIMSMVQQEVRAQMTQVSADAGYFGEKPGTSSTARKEKEPLGAYFQLESLEEEPDAAVGTTRSCGPTS